MPSRDAAAGSTSGLSIAVAAVMLVQALQYAKLFRGDSILSLAAAMVFAFLALFPERLPEAAADRIARATLLLLGVVIIPQLFILAWRTPAMRPDHAGLIRALLALAAMVIVAEVAGLRHGARLRLPLLIALYLVVGVLVIRAAQPAIDVYLFHVEAVRALGQGHTPYGGSIPNIYEHEGFYGPGLVVDGRVQIGFPYPPLSLLLAAPGQLLAGDFRYGNLVAMALAALLIGTARPGRVAIAAAALFLFMSRTYFVLDQGWTDPYVVLMLAATVWCALRAPSWTPFALGLLFAVKQYTVLAVPLVALLYSGPSRWRDTARAVLVAGLVAAAVTLPFFVADPAAFIRDVLVFQTKQPFRADSLSFPALWVRVTSFAPPPQWIAFVAAAVSIAVGLGRAPRTPAGFATATACTLLVFFAFGKQAFVNYYLFVLGALCCALAATAEPTASATA